MVEYKNSKNESQISFEFLRTESSEVTGFGMFWDGKNLKSTEDMMSFTERKIYFNGDFFPLEVFNFKMKVQNLSSQVSELSLKVTQGSFMSLKKDILLEATYDCEREAL